ncbi:uncharacterized protein LOC116160414 [Photinus pyralis]|uniref:uncharacterized protein LOC116160414 n=1 Tax=Photinus pyralis TaxID=7054 RepID=UPI0012671094|nr:uncharacterized protein LOC116160414 [Photinus pyralis]
MNTHALFVAILLVGAVQSRRVPQKTYEIWYKLIKPYNPNCLVKANISAWYAKEITLQGFVPDQENVKRYFDCLYVSMNLFRDDGEIIREKLITLAPYMTEALVDECIPLTKSEVLREDKSRALANCLLNAFVED